MFSGAGGGPAQWGDSVGRRGPMGHTASVRGPAPPPPALAPRARAPAHPAPLSCPRRVRPRQAHGGAETGRSPGHRGVVPPPLRSRGFRPSLPLRLVSSSRCGPDEPMGDSHRGAGPAPEMGPWAADPGIQATRRPGPHPGAGEKGPGRRSEATRRQPSPALHMRPAVKPRGRRDPTLFPLRRLGGHLPVSRFHLLRVKFCPSQ